MIYKKIMTAALLFALVPLMAAPMGKEEKEEKIVWVTDYKEARKVSRAKNRPILLFFTNFNQQSQLMQEIFANEEVNKVLASKLVFVMINPSGGQADSEIKAQNQKLEQEYRIRTFPNVIILNSHGNQIAQFGYTGADPAIFIGQVMAILENPANCLLGVKSL